MSMAGPVVEPGEPRTFAQKLARVALVVVVLAIAALWIFAWFFAKQGAADRFDDRSWSSQANAICARWQDKILELPPARSFADIKPKTEALRQRAVVGEQANAYVAEMIAELKTLRSTDQRTAELTQLWLTDYDAYLKARQTHVARWQAGEDPRFAEPAVKGEPLSRGMDGFAEANEMPRCEVPGDLG